MAGMGDIASGELARRAGVSADTLRHYERVGVLARPARSANNYRLYPEAALGRVLMVRRALAFGFSLAELAIVLRERERGAPPLREASWRPGPAPSPGIDSGAGCVWNPIDG